MAITVRTFYPVSPDYMEVNAWALAPIDESAEDSALRLDNFLTFLGPGGFATPDDVEMLESCQRGFANREVAWSDISRGMKREHPSITDELQMRAFWRRWNQLMTAPQLAARGRRHEYVELPGRQKSRTCYIRRRRCSTNGGWTSGWSCSPRMRSTRCRRLMFPKVIRAIRLFIIADDAVRIRSRVKQLLGKLAWSENPQLAHAADDRQRARARRRGREHSRNREFRGASDAL